MNLRITMTAVLVLTAPLPVLAQQPLTLTYGQIQALSIGLQALDTGSDEQCVAKPPTPPVPPKPGASVPAPQPCPYVKSTALLVAMARDMVAIQGPQTALQTAQTALRAEVLSDPKLKDDQARQSAFVPRVQELMTTKVPVYGIEHITLAELNLGPPPGANRMSAATLAQLAPVIPELLGATK